jgi:hypothetical protein
MALEAEEKAEKKAQIHFNYIRKVSDKYILQRFRREFDNVAAMVCLGESEENNIIDN